MKKKMRRRKLTAVQKLVCVLILIGENWRALGVMISGMAVLVGLSCLITADVHLYADYSVALKYLAKCWAAIIGGGALMSLCVDLEEVTR